MDCCEEDLSNYPATLTNISLDVARQVIQEELEKDAAGKCCAEGRNCLFYAVQRDDEDEACELARFILESELVPPGHTDTYGQTALFYAAREGHTRCVEMLLEEFLFDVSHLDHARQTAIFYAARDGRTEALEALVRRGADLNHLDANGDTPIFYAARDNREETIAQMLELGADCNIRNKQKAYPSTIARKYGHKRLAGELDAARKNQQTSDNERRRRPPPRRSIVRPPPPKRPKRVVPPKSKPAEEEVERQIYRLEFSDAAGIWLPATPEQIDEEFAKQYPNIAFLWGKPEPVDANSWQAKAATLMDHLLSDEVEGAWLFAHPVDPVEWGIEDYFNVVKNPMDFSTIKQKLVSEAYPALADFLDDVDLVFDNCILYNSGSSKVGKLCYEVREAYKKFATALDLLPPAEEEPQASQEEFTLFNGEFSSASTAPPGDFPPFWPDESVT